MADKPMTSRPLTIRVVQRGGAGGATYFLAMVGSLVYYWQQASDFWGHVTAVLTALVWPAFVVYDLLAHLGGG